MITTELETAESSEVRQAREMGLTTINRASELSRAIVDNKTLAEAADFMIEIKRRRKQWAEWNKPAKQKLDALKKELLQREQQIDEPMERAENEILKPSISKFMAEQERKRKEEEDKQRAQARKEEEDRRLESARKLEESGDKEMADAVLDIPIPVAPVVIPRAEAPVGVQLRDAWRYEVVDANLVPREYLTIDDKKIGGVVRALKSETNIPGVRIYCEKVVAGRI